MAKPLIKIFRIIYFKLYITMNINTSILKSLSFPINYLEKNKQIKSTIIYLISIIVATLVMILLLGFQIFYIH